MTKEEKVYLSQNKGEVPMVTEEYNNKGWKFVIMQGNKGAKVIVHGMCIDETIADYITLRTKLETEGIIVAPEDASEDHYSIVQGANGSPRITVHGRTVEECIADYKLLLSGTS